MSNIDAATAAQIERALQAIEEDAFERAGKVIEALSEQLGESHPRVAHLRGLSAWAQGELETAAAALLEAADGQSDDAQICLDCAELHLAAGLDIDAAEATLNALLSHEGLAVDAADEARILLAQCRLENAEPDPEETLELLDACSAKAKASPVARSTRAAALVDLERTDEAIALLEAEARPDDADLQYMLAFCYDAAGRDEDAALARIRVRDLDAGDEDYEEIDAEEREGLRAIVDELLEDLPDPLLKRVGRAAVAVQTRPNDAQIRAGADPRAFMVFEGDAEAGRLDRLVVMRNLLLDALDHESQLPEALIEAMIDEFRRFFGLEDLAVASN